MSEAAPAWEEFKSTFGPLASRGVVWKRKIFRVLPDFQDRRHYLPRSFHRIPPCEKRLITLHRIAEQALVRGRRVHAEAASVTKIHVDAADVLLWPGNLGFEAHRDSLVGLDLDDQDVWLNLIGRLAVETVRNRFKGYGDFGNFAGQALSGTQIEWDAAPAPVFDM